MVAVNVTAEKLGAGQASGFSRPGVRARLSAVPRALFPGGYLVLRLRSARLSIRNTREVLLHCRSQWNVRFPYDLRNPPNVGTVDRARRVSMYEVRRRRRGISGRARRGLPFARV